MVDVQPGSARPGPSVVPRPTRFAAALAAVTLAVVATVSSPMSRAGAASDTVTASTVPTPGTVQTDTSGSGLDAHPYLVYTPHSWRAGHPMPLLVVLHGCQTTAAQQMAANLFNPLADRMGFVVVYPDTSPLENAQPGPTQRCWQFPLPTDWQRGQGDGAAVADITGTVTREWGVDRDRVYVTGMSAGAFLTADLVAEYPDVYAAAAQNAGGAYADGTCLAQDVVGLPAPVSAQLAYAQMGPRARVVPRLMVGGDADAGVPPACADKALDQGLRTDNLVLSGDQDAPIDLTPARVEQAQVPGGRSYTVSDYLDGHGCLIGQRYLVHGMGHYWSGGSSDPSLASFTDPTGPSGAVADWTFLSRFTMQNTADSCGAR